MSLANVPKPDVLSKVPAHQGSIKPILDQALDLTVHRLPQQGVSAALLEGQGRTRLGRIKMFAVLLVCAAPVVASYFAYYVLRPQHSPLLHSKSFGTLVQPPRAMPDVPGSLRQGERMALTNLKDQWLLVSVSGGACDELCEKKLTTQRQLREMLGREKERVDWAWLVNDQTPLAPALDHAIQKLESGKSGFVMLRLDAQSLSDWLGKDAQNSLHLIDPMGNYMMRFPATGLAQDAMKIKKDIERLLRASGFWDKEGRQVSPKTQHLTPGDPVLRSDK